MTGKKGRKCAIAHCKSFQPSHKGFSFFRFPKDPERCKIWITAIRRPELANKVRVHEDRVCEKHFESNMFLNAFRNRLQNTAVPVLYLDAHRLPQSTMAGSLILDNCLESPNLKKMNNGEDELLEIMEPPAFSTRGPKRKRNCIASQQTYLESEKFNVNYNNLQHFNTRLHKSQNTINGKSSIHHFSTLPNVAQPETETPQGPTTMLYETNVSTPATTISNHTPCGGSKHPRQTFSDEQEEELAVFVRDASKYYDGLSSKDVRILAFVYGVCNQVDLPSKWCDNHEASFDWCVRFIKRNKLSPMITSLRLEL